MVDVVSGDLRSTVVTWEMPEERGASSMDFNFCEDA